MFQYYPLTPHTHRWCSIWARTLVVPPRPNPIYSTRSPIVETVTVTTPHPLRLSYEYLNYRYQWKCVNVLVVQCHSPGRLDLTVVIAPRPLLEKRDSEHSQIITQGVQGMLWLCVSWRWGDKINCVTLHDHCLIIANAIVTIQISPRHNI